VEPRGAAALLVWTNPLRRGRDPVVGGRL